MRYIWAALLLAAAPAAAETEAGVGATATAGSGGYRRLAAFADATLTGGRIEPYGWGEAAASRELRQLSIGAGAWDNWTKDARGKAGLGVAGGRYDDGHSASSLLAELGAEKDVSRTTLGAGWRLTYGTLSSSSDAPALEAAAQSRGRGRRARGEGPSYAVNELSAYGRTATDAGVPGLRLGIEYPPDGPAVTSETASFRFPVGTRLYVTPAVTLEQGSADAVYFSLTAYCRL